MAEYIDRTQAIDASYTRKGYMNAEYEDYYRWLAYSAYYRIKELEEK